MSRPRTAPDVLVGDIVRHAARTTPHELAATHQDRELTFAALDRALNQVARALARRGVEVGHRVAWWGETSLDVMPIFNTLARLGATFMPVNRGSDPTKPRTCSTTRSRACSSPTPARHARGGLGSAAVDA